MSDKLMWKTLWVAVAFFLCSMSGMLVYANEKAVVITEGDVEDLLNRDDQNGQNNSDKPGLQEPRSFVFDVEGKAGERLCIPLESGVKAEKVIIENRYMDGELRITILGGDAEFYNTRAVYGDITGILAATYEGSAIGVLMKFSLNDVYECKSVLEGGNLYIDLVAPAEVYENIIVIDPVCRSLDAVGELTEAVAEAVTENVTDETLWQQEQQITLDVAKRLKKKLDATDIKAYFTRLEEKSVSEEEKQALASTVNADFILAIGASFDETNEKKYGTEAVYNANFFTPEVNSVELADACLRQVVTHISGRAIGLAEATESTEVVWNAQVPAVLLKVGYLTNEQEAALLAREDYREKIAEGLYQAILKMYEEEK